MMNKYLSKQQLNKHDENTEKQSFLCMFSFKIPGLIKKKAEVKQADKKRI